jgi:hypothetical protein
MLGLNQEGRERLLLLQLCFPVILGSVPCALTYIGTQLQPATLSENV